MHFIEKEPGQKRLDFDIKLKSNIEIKILAVSAKHKNKKYQCVSTGGRRPNRE